MEEQLEHLPVFQGSDAESGFVSVDGNHTVGNKGVYMSRVKVDPNGGSSAESIAPAKMASAGSRPLDQQVKLSGVNSREIPEMDSGLAKGDVMISSLAGPAWPGKYQNH